MCKTYFRVRMLLNLKAEQIKRLQQSSLELKKIVAVEIKKKQIKRGELEKLDDQIEEQAKIYDKILYINTCKHRL